MSDVSIGGTILGCAVVGAGFLAASMIFGARLLDDWYHVKAQYRHSELPDRHIFVKWLAGVDPFRVAGWGLSFLLAAVWIGAIFWVLMG